MTAKKKDTIYVDIDDDITALIDRVKSSKSSIVALVMPKRAQMISSSVNMRLLKRAADSEKKRLVLITSEASVLKLAGTVGLYVAKSLTSKPYIPPVTEDKDETLAVDVDNTEVDKSKPVGELAAGVAGAAVAAKSVKANDEEETIELDNEESNEVDGITPPKDAKPPKKDRKLKVPNFDKFRLWLFGGGGLVILLLILGFFAYFIWPRATITIKTETSTIDTAFEFTANTSAATVDEATLVIPATTKEIKESDSEKITATGKKDLGNKAKGFVTLYNCNKQDQPISMPAGSRLIVGSAIFLTDAEVTVPASNFTGGGVCKKDVSRDVNVTSQLGGDEFNLSARGGYTAPDFVDISGYGSNMTGGTSNVVTVVSAEDVDAAKEKMLLRNTDEVKAQLEKQLSDAGYTPLRETFTSTPGAPSSSPAVGEQATNATVTMEFVYTMTGVKKEDFDNFIKKAQEAKIDTSKQRIYDNGLSSAKITVVEKKSPGEIKLAYKGTGVVGPQLDAESIAREVAGKPGGETKQIIEARPGIASAEVRYDPFYVLRTPKKVSRITIQFDVNGEIQ